MIARSVLSSRHCILCVAASRQLREFSIQTRRSAYTRGLRELSRCQPWRSATSESSAANVALSEGLEKGESAPPDVQEELKKLGFGVLPVGVYSHLHCPKCGGGDKGDRELALTVTNDRILWNCFRGKCGWKGNVDLEETRRRLRIRQNLQLQPLSQDWLTFFQKRCISLQTLQRNKIQQETRRPGAAVAVFPFFKNGELVNVKYRTVDKRFWQLKEAEKVLYGWDDIRDQKEIIIVEGEIDKLSLEEAGYRNVASVPDGAPAHFREGPTSPTEEGKKFSFIPNSKPAFEKAERIIIATDSDEPGLVLARELARRFGQEKCLLATWTLQKERSAADGVSGPAAAPFQQSSASTKYKDANEVLCAGGPAAVKACIESAIPFPVNGLTSIESLAGDLLQEYARPQPAVAGLQSGWTNLDSLYRVMPSCVTVVAGPMLSGKTDFVFELLCRLCRQHRMKAGLCLLEAQLGSVDGKLLRVLGWRGSFEVQDLQAAVKRLLEKHTGKPFAATGSPLAKMQPRELEAGLGWLSEHFALISGSAAAAMPLDSALELARIAISRRKLNGLLIDSYHALPPATSSPASAISETMRKLQSFAAQHRLHIWLTVHSLSPEEAQYALQLSDVGLTISRNGQATLVNVEGNNRRCSRSGTARFIHHSNSPCILPAQGSQ